MVLVVVTGCVSDPVVTRTDPGDGFVVCGEFFDIDTPVVLWSDPGGFNAYHDKAQTKGHFNDRVKGLEEGDGLLEQVRAEGWTLPLLQRRVHQVVIHYDAVGSSRGCFEVLERRGLSAHFLLDVDGTIYQTLDLKERAWHAGEANSRSVGIEIANLGAYPVGSAKGGGEESVTGVIQGRRLQQQPFTDEQYAALAKLLIGLDAAFPRLALSVPRNASGEVVDHLLLPGFRTGHRGLLAHWHLSEVKVDPGPAFDWERLKRETVRASRGSGEPPIGSDER